MADKSWMLNPKAIRHANECIRIIKEVEGVRLKLSQPDFLQTLHRYVDELKSRDLGTAYSNLVAMAGVGNIFADMPAKTVVAKAVGDDYSDNLHHEMVEENGHKYPKYRNGMQFKGVHRGIPNYG